MLEVKFTRAQRLEVSFIEAKVVQDFITLDTKYISNRYELTKHEKQLLWACVNMVGVSMALEAANKHGNNEIKKIKLREYNENWKKVLESAGNAIKRLGTNRKIKNWFENEMRPSMKMQILMLYAERKIAINRKVLKKVKDIMMVDNLGLANFDNLYGGPIPIEILKAMSFQSKIKSVYDMSYEGFSVNV